MTAVRTLTSLLFFSVAALASDVTVAITDTSPPSSPLQNSGTVILSTASANGKTLFWYQDQWTIKNVSTKPVMAFVETLHVQYANGQSAERVQEHDAFFHSQMIDVGEDLNVGSGGPEGKVLVDNRGVLNSEDFSPAADVAVRWVQFADGSTFGDEKYASDLLDFRQGILTTLSHLNQVYRTEGPEKFQQELQTPVQDGKIDAYVDHIRAVQKKSGTEAAYRQLKFHLKMGEERRHFIR